MKKKKLAIFILVMIMVLSIAITALVGCDDKKKDPNKKPEESGDVPTVDVAPEGYKLLKGSLTSALEAALENSAEGNLVNSLAASAQLTVGAKYGDSTSKYVVKFGADVSLDGSDDATEFGLSIVDAKANNANILNVHYYEYVDLDTGVVYVDLGSGDSAQHFAIKALSLKNVLKEKVEGFPITDKTAQDINNTVVNKIESAWDIINIVTGFGHSYLSNDNSEILFRLKLDEVLESAKPLLGIIDEYTGTLGLDLNSGNLAATLPNLTIDLKFGLKNAGDNEFKSAIFTGVKAELSVASKDLVIKRTDESNFIRVNIAKDTELELGLDFAFGSEVGKTYIPSVNVDFDDYQEINAINFSAGGELTLNKKLGADFSLNGKPQSIAIPAGTYTIKIAADLDPVQLLDMNFNASGTNAILGLVESIVNKVVKNLSIDIADKDDPTDETRQLKLSIVNGKAYFPNLTLLGTLGTSLQGLGKNGVEIAKVINLIKTFIPEETPKDPSGNNPSGDNPSGSIASGSGETESGEKTEAILKAVAGIIKNLTIEAADGKLAVDLKNQVIASRDDTNEAGDKIADTTLDASVKATKDGLTINAALKNIVTDAKNWNKNAQTNINATITANKTGVTIEAKSENLNLGGIELPIDLKIVLNSFKLGDGSANK